MGCGSSFPTKTTNLYISAKNKHNATKPSGYDPWTLPRSSMASRMTLSSKPPVRKPQGPSSTPLLDPPFLTHFQYRYQHEIFRLSSLGVKKHHSCCQKRPCPPCLPSGRLTKSSKYPLLDPPF